MHEAKIDEEHAKLDALEEDEEEEGAEPKPARERPPFNMEEFQENFDEQFPPIEIPGEVIDDIDSDYDFEWVPPEEEQ